MIVIPTRNRVNSQTTIRQLPPALRKQVMLVCPKEEAEQHRNNWPEIQVVVQPDSKMTISKKRAWIMKNHPEDKMVMLDDDLRFFIKREEDPTRMVVPTDEQRIFWFKELFKKLSKEIPHAGFSAKLMNNRMPPGWKSPARMIYSLGYYLPVVLKECELGRIGTREDMDVTLQLLSKGYPNAVNYTFCAGQNYGSPGGCTGERSQDSSDTDAIKLAELHPSYVKAVQREYKHKPRTEVICAWLKALRDGQQRREAGRSRVQKRVR